MFYLIGIGLGNEKDITFKGLEIVKNCEKVFLENYTSRLVDFDLEKIEEFYGKEIVLADRELIEKRCEKEILELAKEKDVALLVVGSPLGATTHNDILERAGELGVGVGVVDNAGILGAVGVTGLSLYKFGRVTTIPFDNECVKSPYDVVCENKRIGMHSLVLLDIQKDKGEFKFMAVREGLDYLIRMGLDKETMVVGCGGLGSCDSEVVVGRAGDVVVEKFPQCFVVMGKLHFSEEEKIKKNKKRD